MEKRNEQTNISLIIKYQSTRLCETDSRARVERNDGSTIKGTIKERDHQGHMTQNEPAIRTFLMSLKPNQTNKC